MSMHELVIQSCRHLLRPVVRFLLRQGVLWSEFAELAKETYVEIARADYGIDGRPTNNSRVAMLTGLSRREVARVRDVLLDLVPQEDERQGNRMARILAGWYTDPEFTTTNGTPQDLTPTTFGILLSCYAGDLPHTAVRKEMLKHGLIEELSDGRVRVLKRDFVYSSLDPEIVRQMGVALHDHAATIEHNLNQQRNGKPRFERLAENAAIPATSVDAFESYVADRGMAFLEDVDAWLAEKTTNEEGATTVRVGAGAYLIRTDA
jgi:hypothetical protein